MKSFLFCRDLSQKRLFARDRVVILNAGHGSGATPERPVNLRESFANERGELLRQRMTISVVGTAVLVLGALYIVTMGACGARSLGFLPCGEGTVLRDGSVVVLECADGGP
jgi:hypothetical protein